MKLGKKKTQAAKQVAQERSDVPRALKQIVVSMHEDGKTPHIVRTYRKHVADETVRVYDRMLNEHTIEAKKGDLDWSRGSTVGEQIFDEEGKLLAIVSLSHDKQYQVQSPNFTVFDRRLNRRRASRTDYKAERVEFSGWTVKSPNAWVPRFNIFTDEPADILTLWQQESDSPDATWVDGKAPTLEQLAQKEAEYQEKKKAQRERRLTGAAANTDGDEGPKGPDELGPGQNF